jgi:hypothetical protein
MKGLLAFAVLLLCEGTSLAQEVSQIPFCEAITDLARWNGAMVEIRGVVEGRRGYWLSGRDCKAALAFEGLTFENIMALTDPKSDARLLVHRVDYVWDERNRQRFGNAVDEAVYTGRILRATVVGLLETRTPLTALARFRERVGYFGFGDQGVGPAQILVKEARDISLGAPVRSVPH